MDQNKVNGTLQHLNPEAKGYAAALGNGISCRVAPNGSNTLELRARLHDKTQRLTLGRCSATTASEATATAA